MNLKEKRKFIKDLTKAVCDDALSRVNDMPIEWDGRELRYYLAEKFEYSRIPMPPSRVLAYREVVVKERL